MEELILKTDTLGRQLGPRSADMIASKLFEGRTNLIIAEIGVWRGEHAEAMYDLLKPQHMLLVDVWDEVPGNYFSDNYHVSRDVDYVECWRRMHGKPGVIIVKTPSVDAALCVNMTFDYVYIDGSHLYLDMENDLNCWYPKMNRPGLFAGHDYINSEPHCGVKKAVDEFFPDGVEHDEFELGDWWRRL